MMILWFAVIGFMVYYLFNKNNSNVISNNSNSTQILDERFANGEIDEAEYIKKKRILESKF